MRKPYTHGDTLKNRSLESLKAELESDRVKYGYNGDLIYRDSIRELKEEIARRLASEASK